MKVRFAFRTLAAAGVAAFVACADPGITDLGDGQNASIRSADLFGSRRLIECPTSETTTNSAVVTPLGGIVHVGTTQISIPAGALLSDVLVTVTVPASKYVEVDITVQGQEHFVFELPVAVTLSYDRCTRSDINFSPLSAWYIDSQTKRLLEEMHSIDNKLLRTVTFTTPHLSGYAIAN